MSTFSSFESKPSYSGSADSNNSSGVTWGLGTAFFVWALSLVVSLVLQIIVFYAYSRYLESSGGIAPLNESQIPYDMWVALISTTFPAHLLLFGICWYVITDRRRRPFFSNLGWSWTERFKWYHAVGLAVVMNLATFGIERFLPHRETQLDQLLKMGGAIKYIIAILAVLTAPLVEELVYRGILYPGVERVWGKTGAIITTTLLFALVHVPQYIESPAAITTIFLLSAILTLLRASTGKLLPCFIVHLAYNGIQSVALIAFNQSQ